MLSPQAATVTNVPFLRRPLRSGGASGRPHAHGLRLVLFGGVRVFLSGSTSCAFAGARRRFASALTAIRWDRECGGALPGRPIAPAHRAARHRQDAPGADHHRAVQNLGRREDADH